MGRVQRKEADVAALEAVPEECGHAMPESPTKSTSTLIGPPDIESTGGPVQFQVV
jgi:hypothetical protein